MGAATSRADGAPARDVPSMLEGAVKTLDAKVDIDPDIRAEAYATLASIYSSWNRYEDAQDNLRKAREIYDKTYGEHSRQALEMEEASLVDERYHGRYAHLIPRADRFLDEIGTRTGSEWQRLRFQAIWVKVSAARGIGDLETARTVVEELIAEERNAGLAESADGSRDIKLAAWIAIDEGRYVDADALLRQAIAIDVRLYPPLHPQSATDLNAVVDILNGYGDDEDALSFAELALELRQRAYGPNHVTTAIAYLAAAMAAGDLGQVEKADRYFTAATSATRALNPPNPTAVAGAEYLHGFFLLGQRRFDAAEPLLTACVRAYAETPEVWHWRRAVCEEGASYCAAHRSGGEGASAALARAIEEHRKHTSSSLPTALWLMASLAAEQLAPGGPEQQLAWLDEALAELERGGRAGSLLGRQIEAARLKLGAPRSPPTPKRGRALIEAARAITARVEAQLRDGG
jgi:tetratricopeptide (TPR) repeat protein